MSKFSLKSLHQEIGESGERDVFDWLVQEGFNVKKNTDSDWTSPIDLSVVVGDRIKCLEVKKAYPKKQDNGKGFVRTRYLANLTSDRAREFCGKYYVIFICVDSDGIQYWFCIPSEKISGKTITITSHPLEYTGKYAKYLFDRESVLDWLTSSN